jgi:hypothetical protein
MSDASVQIPTEHLLNTRLYRYQPTPFGENFTEDTPFQDLSIDGKITLKYLKQICRVGIEVFWGPLSLLPECYPEMFPLG